MSETEWQAKRSAHKNMLAALESGTATPEQQIAAFAHLCAIKQQRSEEMREAQRESRDAYAEGRWAEREEQGHRC